MLLIIICCQISWVQWHEMDQILVENLPSENLTSTLRERERERDYKSLKIIFYWIFTNGFEGRAIQF